MQVEQNDYMKILIIFNGFLMPKTDGRANEPIGICCAFLLLPIYICGGKFICNKFNLIALNSGQQCT